MAQDKGGSTMELGSNQNLIGTSSNKKIMIYAIVTIVMLAALGGIVALIVVLSGGEAEPVVTTTTAAPTTASEPSTPVDPTSPATVSESTVEPPTSPETTPEPKPPLDIEKFIRGEYSPSPFNATWTAGGEMFFRNSDGDLVLYNIEIGETKSLVSNTTSQVLQQSSRVMQLSPDGNEVILAYNVDPVYRHSFMARYAAVNTNNGNTVYISPLSTNAGKSDDVPKLQNFVWGSTGTALAFVYLNNVYYQSDLSSAPRQITTTGQVDVIFNGVPDWVYEEEVFGSNNAIWFSKDSSKIAYATFNDTEVRKMYVPHYGVPGSVDDQYTQHREIRYPKTGTTNPTVSVTLLDVNTVGSIPNVYTAPTGFPILKTVTFVTNSSIAIVWTNRVQTQMRIELCSAGQSTCSLIYSYSEHDGWIDKVPLFFNEAGTSFITILPQNVRGYFYKQIVQASPPLTGDGEWTTLNRVNTEHTVLEILAWTPNGEIWYTATGLDTMDQHIYKIIDGGALCFTCLIVREDGNWCLYNEAALNNAGDRITLNCAGPAMPQILIYNTDGTLIRVWDDNAELSELTSDLGLPIKIRYYANINPGLPAADVQVQVPADYETRTNVPLLVYVYGGPETALVTSKWSLDWGSYLVSRWGIAVAHIDGRGSGRRGIENMFALNERLGSVEVEDQIAVTKFLHDNLSWIDRKRTCIWGWSYGGYAATKALAEGGDVFKCAAAVAPVVDWKYYDTIYTERYMGLPTENQEGYEASTLLTEKMAENLRNKSYFLIHGTEDDNVHYQHTMLLSRFLQRRDVYFKQMSYTDEDHGLGDVRPHLYHALEKFLQENLL
ncbi:hypothetical protein PYW07_015828 [Mythimna separata]|uniref:Venom dipeptidyl peptidase 4 n=1 Tax=Mythimna separata TaxID=271217 RepID=A0AAD8DUS7_MYTSE|nr:hypothetical protein PYW07_015828 [Mythimna separata]